MHKKFANKAPFPSKESKENKIVTSWQTGNQLYRNTLTDFAQAFQNDHNTDAVNEIGPLVSQVILSHSTKSHDFFSAHGGIYSVYVFLS